jgi:hypothetical protein
MALFQPLSASLIADIKNQMSAPRAPSLKKLVGREQSVFRDATNYNPPVNSEEEYDGGAACIHVGNLPIADSWLPLSFGD